MSFFESLLKNKKRKFVFLGEAGSGKTEVSINFALHLSQITNKPIHFFDMDQSKPLYRSRDLKEVLEKENIFFHSGEQCLDSPVVPHGVESIVTNDDNIIIFDVGGNFIGSVNIGQYSEYFNMKDTTSYFIVNPYRALSKDLRNIQLSINQILKSSRLKEIEIISNPNFGIDTNESDVIKGHKDVIKFANDMGYKTTLLTIKKGICIDKYKDIYEEIVKINTYTKYM